MNSKKLIIEITPHGAHSKFVAQDDNGLEKRINMYDLSSRELINVLNAFANEIMTINSLLQLRCTDPEN